jgi:hypothetical protein
MCEAVNSRVYFFRWGITREISLICSNAASSTGTVDEAVAALFVLLVPLAMVLMGREISSILRFLEAGSTALDVRRSDI